jgi:hypothetical protein
MFASLWRARLAPRLGGPGRGPSPRPRTAPGAGRREGGRFRPTVQVLEDRRLLAQVLFGGDVLKETFDDLPGNTNIVATLDDPGYLGGVQVSAAVFHHDFGQFPEAFVFPGGDTTPTQAGQTAQELVMVSQQDTITIHPFLPPGASTAEVDHVFLDVTSGQVTVQGQDGQEVLPAVPPGGAFTTLSASSDDVIGIDAQGSTIHLGPITQLILHDVGALDNVQALVFFPGIAVPPVAKDDVYALPQGAASGQTFQSKDIALTGSPLGSVLDNDTATGGGPLTARPVTFPTHGELRWGPANDGSFTYVPDSTFQGTDSFTYVANDGTSDSNPATVTIVTKGSALDSDGDGVPDAVEALVPPRGGSAVFGDGNGDGTPDYLESKVASLPAADNQYWTLVTSDGTLGRVSNVPTPATPPLPPNVTLPSGLFHFQVEGATAAGRVVVTMTPASGQGTGNANGFYLLNPTAGTWSEFEFDSTTGIGPNVSREEVTLHLVDGQPGDGDGAVNGTLTLDGGPAVVLPLARDGSVTFDHQPGDLRIVVLTGQVSFFAPPGESLTVSKVPGSDVGGTADVNPDGTFVWHAASKDGSFRFGVTDALGNTSTATETVRVLDDQPQVGSIPIGFFWDANSFDLSSGELVPRDAGTLGSDDPGVPTLFGNRNPPTPDSDNFTFVRVQNQAGVFRPAVEVGITNLTLVVVEQPIRAAAFQVHPDGTFRYVPLPGFRGLDEFKIKVSDGYLDSTADLPPGEGILTFHIAVPSSDGHLSPPTGLNAAQVQVPVPVPGLGLKDEGVELFDPDPLSQVTDLQPVANPSPAGDLPPGTRAGDFPLGFLQFTVTVPTVSGGPGAALVKLSLPPDAATPTHYYKFGPTPDNETQHWYDFAFDPSSQTGAVFPGQTDPLTGEVVPAGQVNLHFVDGKRGDDDLSANGTIVDAGGPALFAPAASVTGPAAGVSGQPVTFTLSAADLSPAALAAGFTYTVDWGDGSPAQTVAATPGNGAGVAGAHVFARPGSFTVQVTATDPNGLASTLATATIAVTAPPLPIPTATPPLITALSPVFAAANRRHLTLTVSGLNFTPASAVTFNGRALQTTFVSGNRLVVPNFLGQVRPLLHPGRRRLPPRARGGKGKGLVAVVDPVLGVSAPVPFVIR